MAKQAGGISPITLYTDRLHEFLHEELLNAVNNYHQAHYRWVLYGRLKDSIRTRQALQEIQNMCEEYRSIILNWRILYRDLKHKDKPIPRLVRKYKYRKQYKR